MEGEKREKGLVGRRVRREWAARLEGEKREKGLVGRSVRRIWGRLVERRE